MTVQVLEIVYRFFSLGGGKEEGSFPWLKTKLVVPRVSDRASPSSQLGSAFILCFSAPWNQRELQHLRISHAILGLAAASPASWAKAGDQMIVRARKRTLILWPWMQGWDADGDLWWGAQKLEWPYENGKAHFCQTKPVWALCHQNPD